MYSSRKEIILSRSLADNNTSSQTDHRPPLFKSNINTSIVQDNTIIQIISDDEDADRIDKQHKNNLSQENQLEPFRSLLSTELNKNVLNPISNDTCTSRLNDDEIIRRLDNELFTNVTANITSSDSGENFYVQTTPLKKRKIENLYQKFIGQQQNQVIKDTKELTNQNLNNIGKKINELEYGNVIELESKSSKNMDKIKKCGKTNTESSSEFIVSSPSSKSTQIPPPQRPRLKNTLQADHFEHYLTELTKKYPEMNHKERVLSWKFSSDVSDVEDYINFEKRLEQKEKEKVNTRQLRKIQIENRKNSSPSSGSIDGEAKCNKTLNRQQRQQKIKPLTETIAVAAKEAVRTITTDKTKNIESNNCDNSLEDDNHKNNISISNKLKNNTTLSNQNNKIFTNETTKFGTDFSQNFSHISRGSHENINILRHRNNINPDIDKMRLIQMREDYKQNKNNTNNSNKIRILSSINDSNQKKEQFKVPNVPRKYSTSSPTPASATIVPITTSETPPSINTTTITSSLNRMNTGTTQKEEFYKYLGLETRSPNNKSNNDTTKDLKRRDKISPGRVTRLQIEKITKLMTTATSDFSKVLNDRNKRKQIKNYHEGNNKISNDDIKKQKSNRKGDTVSSFKNRRSSKFLNNSHLNKTKTKNLENKIILSQSFPSPTISQQLKQKKSKDRQDNIEPRRSCGCIVNFDKTFLNISLPSSNFTTNTMTVTDQMKLIKSKSPTKSEQESSNSSESALETTCDNNNESNICIEMRHSYHKRQEMSTSIIDRSNVQFTYDFSNMVREKNPRRLTLYEESKTHPMATKMYAKFTEILKETNNHKITIQERKSYNNRSEKVNSQKTEENIETETDVMPSSFPVISQTNNQEPIASCHLNNQDRFASINESDLKIDAHNQQKNEDRRAAMKSINKLKLYRRILRDKTFINFLKKNRSKLSKELGSVIVRQRRHILEPKKTLVNDLLPNDPTSVINENVEIVKEINENAKLKTDDYSGNEVEESSVKEQTEITNNKLDVPTIQHKSLRNPLSSENGNVLHIYYEQNLLVVVQELLVSFWKYSCLSQMMAKTQQWSLVGECKRRLYDDEVSTLYKNRLCVSDTKPVYIEIRAQQLSKGVARECNLASVYVNVYHCDELEGKAMVYSVQLDTIRGLSNDICYTSISNSRYFVMCWKQEGVLGTSRTGLCKYALTPDLDTLASIREFKTMRHVITYLECIDDNKLIGFGETQITIWNHHTGDILKNFDIEIPLGKNLGSVLISLQKNNESKPENYLFLYQLRIHDDNITENNLNTNTSDNSNNKNPPELNIIVLSLSYLNPKFRLIYTHKLPLIFKNIKSSICNDNYLITTAIKNDQNEIEEDEFLLLPHQPEQIYFTKHHHHNNQHQNSSSFNSKFLNNNFCKLNDSSNNINNCINCNCNNCINVKRFYTIGCSNFIEIKNDTLVVKPIHHYLLNFTT